MEGRAFWVHHRALLSQLAALTSRSEMGSLSGNSPPEGAGARSRTTRTRRSKPHTSQAARRSARSIHYSRRAEMTRPPTRRPRAYASSLGRHEDVQAARVDPQAAFLRADPHADRPDTNPPRSTNRARMGTEFGEKKSVPMSGARRRRLVRTVMRVPRTGKCRKPVRKVSVQERQETELGRPRLASRVDAGREMKGTKLTKEDFAYQVGGGADILRK